ncbi:uncharacterized protein LOC113765056 [Coffea eugenioides]|uniref:uncharacterized protein LOC113765056 n=1 Tax=Coffea eugenioides TaxID=49369 RepID=UPI000F60FB11|nr:uncharacterized protein LOC113765056 [Coffea eugenioides]
MSSLEKSNSESPAGISLSPSPPSMLEGKINSYVDKLNGQSSSENSCANVGGNTGAASTEGTQTTSKFRDRPIPPLPPQPLKRMKVYPKSRSEIWFHFTRLESDRNKAACNYCGAEYACCSNKNGTSGLWNHFKGRCKKNPYKLLAGQTTLRKCSMEKPVMVDQVTPEKCGIKKGLKAGQTTLDRFMVKKEPLI